MMEATAEIAFLYGSASWNYNDSDNEVNGRVPPQLNLNLPVSQAEVFSEFWDKHCVRRAMIMIMIM